MESPRTYTGREIWRVFAIFVGIGVLLLLGCAYTMNRVDWDFTAMVISGRYGKSRQPAWMSVSGVALIGTILIVYGIATTLRRLWKNFRTTAGKR